MLELHESSRSSCRQADDEAGRARRHLGIAGLAPGDLDESRPLDSHEGPPNDDAVDVDGEDAALFCLESREVPHPAYQ